MKITFPIFGNVNSSGKFLTQFSGTRMQVKNSIPNFRERELEAGILGNGWEREFPLIDNEDEGDVEDVEDGSDDDMWADQQQQVVGLGAGGGSGIEQKM